VGQAPSATYAQTIPQLGFHGFPRHVCSDYGGADHRGSGERIKFSALMLFSIIWFTIVYLPVAALGLGRGRLVKQIRRTGFRCGTVVHIAAGVSALSLAVLLGPVRLQEKEPMERATSLWVALGARYPVVRVFGFNAGSALTYRRLATSAFVATNLSRPPQ